MASFEPMEGAYTPEDLLSPSKRPRSSLSESNKRKEMVNIAEESADIAANIDSSLCMHDSAGRMEVGGAYMTHISRENEVKEMQNVQGERITRSMRSSLLNPTSTYNTYDTLNCMNSMKGAYTTHIARQMGNSEARRSGIGSGMPYNVPNTFSAELNDIINANIVSGESSKVYCKKKTEENKGKIHENLYDPAINLYSENVVIETPFSPNLKDLFENSETRNKLDKDCPSWSVQKAIIEPLLAKFIDDVSFCIEALWMMNYLNFLEQGHQETIGPIDQTSLVEGNELKHGVIEGKDYVLVSGEVWKYLSLGKY